MAYWIGVLTTQEYRAERLGQPSTVRVGGAVSAGPAVPRTGDEVVLVAAADDGGAVPAPRPVVFGLGRIRGEEPVEVAYTHRFFDAPLPAAGPLAPATVPGLHPLAPGDYADLAQQLGAETPVPGPPPRNWLVSVALPIEAGTPAEAVQAFWTYVEQLGPSQLPAFVSPSGDELAMQAYLLGEPANQDPEEDDEA
ncbi:MAG TPA: hypothetical protein VK453_21520 [Micromonosporaceae bacterium]|nr:hypothetical protein [Micromonosporaceae bacterium]